MFSIIDVKDHPHNLCHLATLEWHSGGKSVYRVRAGFIAFVDYGRCLNHTFQARAEAMNAVMGGAA